MERIFDLTIEPEKRDQIVFGEVKNWDPSKGECEAHGGLIYFHGLTVGQLQQLIDDAHMDSMVQRSHSAPSVYEYFAFMADWPEVTAHGYCVSPKRRDYNVEIEGLEYKGEVSEEMELELRRLIPHGADEMRIESNGFRIWFD